MRLAALILAASLSSGLAGAAFAQPAPQGPPPPGYGGPDQRPPPGAAGMPPSEQAPPPPAPAMEGAPHGMREKFEAANVTHDGRLTEQQAEAGGLKNIVRHFQEIDRDGKGYVTIQDIHAWHKARHAARQGEAPGGVVPPQGAPPPAAPPPGAPPSQQPY